MNRRQKKLLIAGLLILIGGTLMRFAWALINKNYSTALIIVGSILFLGGVISFANTFFHKTDRY